MQKTIIFIAKIYLETQVSFLANSRNYAGKVECSLVKITKMLVVFDLKDSLSGVNDLTKRTTQVSGCSPKALQLLSRLFWVPHF